MVGYNTDGPGFIMACRGRVCPAAALSFAGAGGAARSITIALAQTEPVR
jgi:shikimate 5-dehydrogenase